MFSEGGQPGYSKAQSLKGVQGLSFVIVLKNIGLKIVSFEATSSLK